MPSPSFVIDNFFLNLSIIFLNLKNSTISDKEKRLSTAINDEYLFYLIVFSDVSSKSILSFSSRH